VVWAVFPSPKFQWNVALVMSPDGSAMPVAGVNVTSIPASGAAGVQLKSTPVGA